MISIVLVLFGFSMNSILGQVRSLSIITHMMTMQLNYPGTSVIFYSKIFEFVTFDLVFTFFPKLDELNEEWFGGVNESYTSEAEAIGYESRYLMTNLGSIPICLVIVLILQTLYSAIEKCTKVGKVHDFAAKKVNGFKWGGLNDVFNEIYIALSFSV